MAKNEETILALSQRQHLIKRMSLTFGRETGDEDYPFSAQKTVAIREILDNSVDVLKKQNDKYKKNIRVHFYKDGFIETQDSGTGIPTALSKTADGKPASSLYLALGVSQAGGNYELDSDRFSSGLNGVGGSSVTMSSSVLIAEVFKDNKIYTLHFKDGKPGFFKDESYTKFEELKDLTILKETKDNRPAEEKKLFKTGTKIKFKLNDTVFQSKYQPDYDDLIDRLKGTSFLVPGLNIEVINEHKEINGKPQREYFEGNNNIKNLVELLQTKDRYSDIVEIKAEDKFIEYNVSVLDNNGENPRTVDVERKTIIELAFSYDTGYDYKMESYVNTIKTRLGGIHEKAFEKALVTAFNEKFKSMRGVLPKDAEPTIEDYKEGLSVVLYVQVSEPAFTSQNKEELGGKELQKSITKKLIEVFTEFVNNNKNSAVVKKIGEKIAVACKNRMSSDAAKKLKRQQNALEANTVMPEKLIDCLETHDENSELYIAEGDSAKTALKSARDSRYQAILPIRGKIINAKKETLSEVLKNQEVQSIIKSIDSGILKEFNSDKMRYNRIFIATDADPDGGAISALITVLLWQLMPEIVTGGHLYKLMPPLFIFKTNQKKQKNYYAYSDEERDQVKKELDKKKIKYQLIRAKGLGESGVDVLEETCMRFDTRTILQITVDDVEKAEKILEVALGKKVEPRREWIEANPFINEDY